MQAKVRRMFPGNNTSVGFFSYYSYIMPQSKAAHIFCMKGGPGVGKSTFMKRVGKRMEEEGFDVDYLHCSSDPDSLDGVVIPGKKAALIDGTAPHVVDPINPGAVDEIINLGEYWDAAGVKANRAQIVAANAEVGRLFGRAYRYIAAAKVLYDAIAAVYKEATNPIGGYLAADMIIGKELDDISLAPRLGRVKKQFASAITPSGFVHFLDTLIDETYTVYAVPSVPAVGHNTMLDLIADAAIARGQNVEVYYCPIDPAVKAEHLIIPEKRLAFVSENQYHTLLIDNKTQIDLGRYINTDVISREKERLEFDLQQFKTLLNRAVDTIKQAKLTHDDMESCYIPNMDFDRVRQKSAEVTERILKL